MEYNDASEEYDLPNPPVSVTGTRDDMVNGCLSQGGYVYQDGPIFTLVLDEGDTDVTVTGTPEGENFPVVTAKDSAALEVLTFEPTKAPSPGPSPGPSPAPSPGPCFAIGWLCDVHDDPPHLIEFLSYQGLGKIIS